MVWTGNLFENNTARSGSAGMELNQCSGDIRQSSFLKNRVSQPEDPQNCIQHEHMSLLEFGWSFAGSKIQARHTGTGEAIRKPPLTA